MASKSYHKSVSLFWTMGVPAFLFGILYYAYQTPGWVGSKVQGALGPIVDPIARWLKTVI